MIVENRLDKKLRYADLFSIYSNLLTDKQSDVFSLYCYQDLSLSEISADLSISRQAVYDTIHRTEVILDNYEEKLKLSELYSIKSDNMIKINDILNDMEIYIRDIEQSELADKLINKFDKLKAYIEEIQV